MTLFAMIEIGGSLLILSAFAGAQTGRLDGRSLPYLLLNLTGSAVLAVIALTHRSWGFLLLEGTWAVVSAISLASGVTVSRPRIRGPRPRKLFRARAAPPPARGR